MPPNSNQSSLQTAQNSTTPPELIVPPHTHNGIDSPKISSGTTVYSGNFDSSGVASTLRPLPTGWTVTRPGGTGVYQVNHNLGRPLCVMAYPETLSASQGFQIQSNTNSFTLIYYVSGSGYDSGFTFIAV